MEIFVQSTMQSKMADYLPALVGIVFVLTMGYVVPRQLAETEFGKSLTDFVWSFVPLLSRVRNEAPEFFTPFWGFYYSTMWCLSFVYFLYGFLSAFVVDAVKKRLLALSVNSALGGSLLFSIAYLIWIYFPFFPLGSVMTKNEEINFYVVFYSLFILITTQVVGGIWGAFFYKFWNMLNINHSNEDV